MSAITETDPEALRAAMKKLNSQAGQIKMDLHDAAEDLPNDWEHIMDVAQRAFDAYRTLAEMRARLKQLEG